MYILLAPLVGLSAERRVNILEKLIPDIRKSSESVITLSSAAILLTFSVIQLLGKEVSYKGDLIISWYLFVVAIAVGIIIGIVIYIFKANYLVLMEELQEPDKNKSEENKQRVKNLLNKTFSLAGALFQFAVLQLLTFFGAMIFVISFIVRNI